MNKEILIKLLKSENKEDNLIALNIIRAQHPRNWGAFLIELKYILSGETYEATDYYPSGPSYLKYSLDLRYFHYASDALRMEWYEKID